MSKYLDAMYLTEIGEPLEGGNNVILGPLQPDELLVDIHATGICHTDVACMTGKLPIPLPQVLGHGRIPNRSGCRSEHFEHPKGGTALSYLVRVPSG